MNTAWPVRHAGVGRGLRRQAGASRARPQAGPSRHV